MTHQQMITLVKDNHLALHNNSYRRYTHHAMTLQTLCVVLGIMLGPSKVLASDDKDRCDDKFDFIVVGSGPGGGVVASRLAQAGFDTVVLEAGPDYSGPDVQVPLLWPASTINTQIEWAMQANVTGDEEQKNVLYPRSSNVGGCALHNAMQAVYPYPETFTELSSLTGEEEFAEDKMRARFIKIEKNEYGQDETNGHGTQGFMSTSFGDLDLISDDPQFLTTLGYVGGAYPGPIPSPFPGLNFNPDINAPSLNGAEGVHFCPASVSPGQGYKRSGVYGLLKGTEEVEETLTIKPNSFVKQILFRDGSKPKAYAVTVQEGTGLYSASTGNKVIGKERVYCARKEIIISAGAFNTPQILKLSGVGPEDELEELGIDVVADVPGVGKNLQDKVEVTIQFEMNNVWKIFSDLAENECPLDPADPNALFGSSCFQEYVTRQFPNVFTSTGVFFGITKKSSTTEPRPDLYIQVTPSSFNRYEPGWVLDAYSTPNVLTFNTATAFSDSVGEVTLKSADPFEQPFIDFAGYSDTELTKITTFITELSAVMNNSTQFTSTYVNQQIRPDSSVDFGDADAVKEWVRKNAWGHHACCSAKIGDNDDELAVLDGKFRVRNVKSLRVVDASAFPKSAGFFPTVPIMMLAEKAADDIIAKWAEDEFE